MKVERHHYNKEKRGQVDTCFSHWKRHLVWQKADSSWKYFAQLQPESLCFSSRRLWIPKVYTGKQGEAGCSSATLSQLVLIGTAHRPDASAVNDVLHCDWQAVCSKQEPANLHSWLRQTFHPCCKLQGLGSQSSVHKSNSLPSRESKENTACIL